MGSDDAGRIAGAGRACLGIIGAGQLGMLLCHAARRLGVRTVVLTPDAAAPGVHVADAALVAATDDADALEQLIASATVITFEFEDVPDTVLARLQAAVDAGRVRVYPEVSVLARLKDKGLQKTWLAETSLPTLPYVLAEPDIDAAALRAGPVTPPLVQKARRGGYDGKGVQILRGDADLARLWPVPSVVEVAVEGCREVGVVIARDGAGELRAYPPVEMDFDPEWNSVYHVATPVALPPDIAARCASVARDAVDALGSRGIFAVELFVTDDQQVFINEISPRVHNSGHLTIEAYGCDQFEQHVRAVIGLPLAAVTPRAPAAVMLNLLYEDDMAPAAAPRPYSAVLAEKPLTVLHWYGKTELRRGRKMGHITALGDTVAAATASAEDGLTRLRRGQLGQIITYSRAGES